MYKNSLISMEHFTYTMSGGFKKRKERKKNAITFVLSPVSLIISYFKDFLFPPCVNDP